MENNKLRPIELGLSMLLVVFLLLLAAGGFFAPIAAATGFGIPLAAPVDAFYLHVKADRDLGAALAVAALLWLGERRTLGALLAAFTIEPICDAILLINDPRGQLTYALLVHGSAAAYCALLSWRLLSPLSEGVSTRILRRCQKDRVTPCSPGRASAFVAQSASRPRV